MPWSPPSRGADDTCSFAVAGHGFPDGHLKGDAWGVWQLLLGSEFVLPRFRLSSKTMTRGWILVKPGLFGMTRLGNQWWLLSLQFDASAWETQRIPLFFEEVRLDVRILIHCQTSGSTQIRIYPRPKVFTAVQKPGTLCWGMTILGQPLQRAIKPEQRREVTCGVDTAGYPRLGGLH